PLERPPYIISKEPLNPDWISGFSEGDSSFYIYIYSNNNEVQARFSIGQNEREKLLLIKLQSFFNGVGSIYIDKTNENFVNYKISKKEDLINIIIPHFNTYE